MRTNNGVNYVNDARPLRFVSFWAGLAHGSSEI